MNLLVEMIVPPVMLAVELLHVERCCRTVQERRGCQLYGVAQKREAEVGMAVNVELSGSVPGQPCLCADVIMERASLCFQQLTADRHVVLVPFLFTVEECGGSSCRSSHHR